MDDRAHLVERALAERLRRARPGLARANEPTAPLSYIQQSLWIQSRLAEGEPVGNRPLWLTIRGRLDVEALRGALEAIVRRHAVLRTTFPTVGSEPIQRISAPGPIDLPTVDVSNEPHPDESARRRADEHVRRPFDLTTEFPFRPLLLRRGPADHLLAVSFHHIAFDGWSERLFVNELCAHYDAAVEGRAPIGVPDLQIDFADYARWEREDVDEARIERDLEYWRRRLADLPPDLNLPPDRRLTGEPCPPVVVRIPRELTERLDDLATSEGATLFMVLLAALQTLIARLSGQDDLVIGVPTAGRPLPETEPLIGCFINTMAIRSDLSGNPGFLDVLAAARTATLEALDHARAPFGRVFGEIRPWTPDRIPLYRVQFQLRNFPEPFHTSAHLDVAVTDVAVGPGNHLAVRAARDDDGIELTVGHDPTRLGHDTVERWVRHYLTLLAGVAAQPTTGIRDLPLLDEAEQRTVVVDFNRGRTRSSETPPLVAERLRSVSALQPDTVAVEQAGTAVTYRELDEMVDRVAAWFAGRGLGAEDRVVVYSDRSLATVVGVFGALRAGVAYIPVDAALTAQWLDTVIADAQPALVLTRPHLVDGLRGLRVPVEAIDELLSGPAPEPVDGRARPGDLAYVLYTSGSTGTPKGVLVEQGNLAWLIDSVAKIRRLGPDDRVVLFHSISFDGVVTNLHIPLTAGATIVVRDEDAFGSVPRLLRWLEDQRITMLKIPTGMFHVIAEEVLATGADLPPTLRFISFGGEQVRADLVQRWLERFGERVALHNVYGPTETTVFVTHHAFGIDDLPLEWAPIGSPIPGTSVYVLDPHGHPTPIGVPGEIHIAGPLVARGYLGNPELTEARFVPDPFAPGAKMYRSGDVGRWLPNGDLEVLGRVDRQVKVRGFRVEPGETEAVLRALPEVQDAVVVPRRSADGTTALHAYFVGSADPVAVREALRRDLPEFLVPATVTWMETFPRTVTGKLDVRRLPEPTRERPASEQPAVDAAGEITRLWQEVLGVESVDPHATFFALGGHSLLAIRLVSRLRDRLGLEIPLPLLFEHPSLAEFTAAVTRYVDGDHPTTARSEPIPDLTVGDPSDDLAVLLQEIEQLSDEEAAALLAQLERSGDEQP